MAKTTLWDKVCNAPGWVQTDSGQDLKEVPVPAHNQMQRLCDLLEAGLSNAAKDKIMAYDAPDENGEAVDPGEGDNS